MAHGFNRIGGQGLVQITQADAWFVGGLYFTEFGRWLACHKVAHKLAWRAVVLTAQLIGFGFQLALQHNTRKRMVLTFFELFGPQRLAVKGPGKALGILRIVFGADGADHACIGIALGP